MIKSFFTRFRRLLTNISISGSPGIRDRKHEMLAFYSQFIKEGDLCFDVGANIGERTDVFLGLGARVVCVEPQHDCISKLTEKYANNCSVTIVPSGLVANEGVLPLAVCAVANTIATFSEKWKHGRFMDYSWEKTIDVPVTTLDALIKDFGVPVFCKIDVEGFERQFLLGLSVRIPVVSFEFAIEFIEDTKLCIDHLKSCGYTHFNYAPGESPALNLPQWVSGEAILSDLRQNPDGDFWGDVYAKL